MRDYALAAYQLSQDFSKTHSPAEVKAFQQLEGRYEIMNALGWIKQLEGQQAADTYRGTEAPASPRAISSTKIKLQHQMKQDQGGHVLHRRRFRPRSLWVCSRGAEAGREKDPELRRCLELGGSLDTCEGLGAMEGMASILMPFAGRPDANEPSPVAGVVLSATFTAGHSSLA